MRRNAIVSTWVAGLVLAAAVYAAGPDRFIGTVRDVVFHFEETLIELVSLLGNQAYDVVRSLAIALFVVFVVLAVLASRRGLRSRGALLVVSGVFVALVWRPGGVGGHWIAALLLAACAAAVMTRRLIAPVAPPVRLR